MRLRCLVIAVAVAVHVVVPSLVDRFLPRFFRPRPRLQSQRQNQMSDRPDLPNHGYPLCPVCRPVQPHVRPPAIQYPDPTFRLCLPASKTFRLRLRLQDPVPARHPFRLRPPFHHRWSLEHCFPIHTLRMGGGGAWYVLGGSRWIRSNASTDATHGTRLATSAQCASGMCMAVLATLHFGAHGNAISCNLCEDDPYGIWGWVR